MEHQPPTVIPFALRAASAAWEPLTIPSLSEVAVPVWFRPQHLPSGVVVCLSREQFLGTPSRSHLTFLQLITALGVAPPEVGALSLYGGQWMPAAMIASFLANTIPDPPANGLPQLQILIQPAVPYSLMMPMPGQPQAAAMTYPTAVTPVFDGHSDDGALGEWPTSPELLRERIDADWHSCLQLERQVSTLRQKLSGTLNKLNGLDRELHPQERMAAAREDLDAWHDARRWNRDAAAKVHRYVKAHDVGVTSSAGRRTVIEQLYARCCSGLMTVEETAELYREMEVYRKLLTQLQTNMHGALATAAQEGEGRARNVLQRISARMAEQRRQWRTGK